MKSKIINILGIIIMFVAFGFIIKTFLSFDVDWANLFSPKYLVVFALSILVMAVSICISTFCWRMVLSCLSGKNPDFRESFKVYSKSNIGKYLPGNVGHYAGRQLFGTSLGLTQAQLVLATILEIAYTALGAFILSLSFAWGKLFEIIGEIFPNANIPLIIAGVFVLGVIGLTAVYFIFRKKAFFKELIIQIKTARFWLTFLLGILLSMVTLSLSGAVFALLMSIGVPTASANIPIIVAASVMSWLIGFVTPGVPGGIGVRESVLVIMLSPFFPQETILATAVLQRVSFIIGDVFAWGTATLLARGRVHMSENAEQSDNSGEILENDEIKQTNSKKTGKS